MSERVSRKMNEPLRLEELQFDECCLGSVGNDDTSHSLDHCSTLLWIWIIAVHYFGFGLLQYITLVGCVGIIGIIDISWALEQIMPLKAMVVHGALF